MPPPSPPHLDGRRLRRQHNRDAALDALSELFREGIYRPSSHEIASRAGLSPRSLFRYFDDVDDLIRAAIERQLAVARPLLDVGVDPDAPTRTKVEGVVAGRMRLFDATRATARAARTCAPRNPVIAAQLREGRSYQRCQLSRLFAPELEASQAEMLPAIDLLCSFEAYDLLRADHGLSRARAAAALVAALNALLVPDAGR